MRDAKKKEGGVNGINHDNTLKGKLSRMRRAQINQDKEVIFA